MSPGSSTSWKPCTICGRAHLGEVDLCYHLPEFDVLRCRRCGLSYVNETFSPSKGEGIPEGYQEIYFPAEQYFLSRSSVYLEDIAALQSHGSQLLDVGCGVGYFLQAAQERGWTVAGVDLDKCAVDMACSRDLDVRWETAEEMSFESEQFDVVTLFNVIEHAPNPRDTLRSISRVLKSEGLLVLETPTDDFPAKYLMRFLYRTSGGTCVAPVRFFFGSGKNGEHVYRFSRKTITRLLMLTGFQIAQIRPVENPGFRFYLRQRGFRKSRLAKLFNLLVVGSALGLARLFGVHSKMVVYARKMTEEASAVTQEMTA